MTESHEPLCNAQDCPFPSDPDWHIPWCQAIKGHRCFGKPTHQHWPKKGMGGHNPESKIVACLCAGMHDYIDNGYSLANAVLDIPGVGKVYRIWRVKDNETILERVIEDGGRRSDDTLVKNAGVIASSSEATTPLVAAAGGDEPSAPPSPAPFPDHPVETLPALQEATVRREPTALIIEGNLSWERYCEIVAGLEIMQQALGFWIGDAIIAGEASFGERAYQPWLAEGYKIIRLQQYAWVCQSIPPSARNPRLSFTMHRTAAALPPGERDKWLKCAEDEGMTSRQFYECVARHRDPKPKCSHEWTGKVVCRLCGKDQADDNS